MKQLIVQNSTIMALVDYKNYERLAAYKWFVQGTNSVIVRITPRPAHRAIALASECLQIYDKEIDHIDRNPFNNLSSNLRACTHAQNMRNRGKLRNTTATSKYRGIYWNKRILKWHAQIFVNNKRKHLGFFIDEFDAAKAYDKAAIEYFGEFANPNFSTIVEDNKTKTQNTNKNI